MVRLRLSLYLRSFHLTSRLAHYQTLLKHDNIQTIVPNTDRGSKMTPQLVTSQNT